MEIMLMNETDPELVEMRAEYDEKDDHIKTETEEKR
jgi:hypothetical protein